MRDLLSRRGALALAALALPLPALAAWPERGLRLLTPAAPGSSTDLAARLYAERLGATLGQPVVVEPRTGADGVIAAEAMLVARDGHSLLFGPAGVVTVTPLLRERMPFDVADIVPVSLAATDFLCVAATPSLEATTIAGVVRTAREQPGTLNVATGLGGLSLALPAFLRNQALDVTVANYRSPPEAIPDLLAGRLHVLLGPLTPMMPLLRDGRARVLAVTNSERTPAAPQIPTVREQGFPELEVDGTLGLFGPRGMRADVRAALAAAMASAATDPPLVERLMSNGIVARAEASDAFSARIARQRAHWASIAASLREQRG